MKFYRLIMIGLGFISAANAADITIFYSPSCPHCHHARDFIKNELIYEYDDLKVTEVNATLMESRDEFLTALKKCDYTSGGVPVMVIGEKCFQGYGDSLKDEIRAAVEADLSETQKQSANDNRLKMKENRKAFISEHTQRMTAITDKNMGVKKK